MEKVSAKVFFTVLWRGVCQVLGWFFGLFGYKRDGRFAKCVWGLFATSSAVIVTLFAIALLSISKEYVDKYYSTYDCEDERCYRSAHVYRDIYFHSTDDGTGYVFNKRTGKKLIRDIVWIAKPTNSKDTLVCFSDGKKRGYFSKNTGRVVIEPKYDHAWVFSEGLASVDDGGFIKFIDGTGKVIIDKKIAYNPNVGEYVFHSGYCVITAEDSELSGLMDKTGQMVLPVEFSSIKHNDELGLWRVQKGKEAAVFDQELKPVIPLMACSIIIDDETIDAIMPDHTIRKYDAQGRLINDFYITGLRTLEYEKDEILYRSNNYDDDGERYAEPYVDSYHPSATARLRAYVAGDGYEGLVTADGHLVTMPLYKDIEAIGYDLYLCAATNYDKVIVNGKGAIVR